ncbi:hypothetical protein BDN70DRAFT_989146 [Pholiota conissans]|uniref:MYND-type domain-containing protein n=1 Tax=Pholiota conissans TaxID=109636 RepID=A0A9P5ZEB8_9AGAR|nr:hypothetical protein BDN70DRAFT_989146 [Pholiota conissans]
MSEDQQRRENIIKGHLNFSSFLQMTHPKEIRKDQQPLEESTKTQKETHRKCGQCEVLEPEGVSYKTCSKCQMVFYCSKECQTLHWRRHKPTCPYARRLDRVEKLADALIGDENLFQFLKLAIILTFGLCDAPLLVEPFFAVVPLVVEPEDFFDFARLRGYIGPDLERGPDEKMKGMLQIGGVYPYPKGYLEGEARSATEAAIKASPSAFSPGSTLAVIRFAVVEPYKTDPGPTIDIPVDLSPALMDIAKQAEPFKMFSNSMMVFWDKAMGSFNCTEYINMTIRRDFTDQLAMRRNMTTEDEQIIRDFGTESSRGEEESFASKTMKLRMQTEQIYQQLLNQEPTIQPLTSQI